MRTDRFGEASARRSGFDPDVEQRWRKKVPWGLLQDDRRPCKDRDLSFVTRRHACICNRRMADGCLTCFRQLAADLESRVDIELGEDVAHVDADGPLAERQLARDLPVRVTPLEEACDFKLSNAQEALATRRRGPAGNAFENQPRFGREGHQRTYLSLPGIGGDTCRGAREALRPLGWGLIRDA